MEIRARRLLDHSPEALQDILTGRFDIVFDDGTRVNTNSVETVYSRFFWEIFRVYPEIPMTEKHHLSYHMRKKNFNSKTTINCYTELFRSAVETYRNNPQFDRNEFMRLIYQINNRLYNHFSQVTLPWSVSLDILDFKRILDDEDIKEIKANVELTPQGVEQAQKDVLKVLMTSPKLDDSVIAKGVRAGILSDGQVAKCIGPCGYFTDIDSHIFPRPVLRGYAEGIRSIHDSLIESRSGAKSLQFSKKPLQDTEYFSRRLQLLCANVKHLHHGDCGSTKYLLWYVNPEERDEDGKVIQKCDLPNLLGKYYLDEKSGTLKAITEQDTHLIGSTIRLRSPMHCQHGDPYGVCSTCFGELYYSVPKDFNIGHLCAITMASPVSQAVLSVKHLDGTAVVDAVQVNDEDKIFIIPSNTGQGYKFNISCKKLNPKLILPAKSMKMLAFLNTVDDVRELNTNRMTNIEYIQIEHTARMARKNEDQELIGEEIRTIPISSKRRLGKLTHEFLAYMKTNGWTYDRKDNIIVDLSNWDFSKLFVTLPLKHHNMADHSAEIEKLIESSTKETKKRLYDTNPGDLIVRLFELVNSKTSVNLAVLETILYSVMVVDADQYNYALPKNYTTGQFGVASNIMKYRSLSAAMAYEKHHDVLNDPISYLVTKRPDHPFDALVVPEAMNLHPSSN